MSTPHVFVVDTRTFPLHLRYQFAGTTPGRLISSHSGLLADIARARPGDPILFYLMGVGFYGIFRIPDDAHQPWWESPTGWLQDELGLPLIYRVPFEPLEVFSEPVTEWEAVDQLPVYARDVRWSLIYRKLKGEQGCSYLFPHEYESLRLALQQRNGNRSLMSRGDHGVLDWENGAIITRQEPRQEYLGSRQAQTIQIAQVRRVESWLQAWFTINIGRIPELELLCGSPSQITWFANEVYTGMGMQRIDVLSILSGIRGRQFRVLELKTAPIGVAGLGRQLGRYIRWIRSYVAEDPDAIAPLLVTTIRPDSTLLNDYGALSAILSTELGSKALQVWTLEFEDATPALTRLL